MAPGEWIPSPLQLLNERAALKSLSRGRAVASHRPVHLRIQVASGCNLDCFMCSEHNRPVGERHGRGLVSIQTALIDRIAQEVFPFSSRLTIGVGGEPMMADNFLYVMEKAFAANQEVHVMTNGTYIHLDSAAEVLTRCVRQLHISIDAATRENYERIRKGSRWERLVRNLEILAEERSKVAPHEKPHLTFHFVLMKSNVHELPAFIEFASEHGADQVHAHHVIPVTEEGQGEVLIEEPERYNEFRVQAQARARAVGIAIDIPDSFVIAPPLIGEVAPNPLKPTAELDDVERAPGTYAESQRSEVKDHAIPCPSPSVDMYIFYDGRVFPCCHPHAHAKMQVGDLRQQSFEEIWNSDHYRNLRRGLFTGDVPLICKSCSLVHDPPPAYEDPEAVAKGPDLHEFYAGRKPEAEEQNVEDRTLAALSDVEPGSAVAEWLAELDLLRKHARALERHRDELLARE